MSDMTVLIVMHYEYFWQEKNKQMYNEYHQKIYHNTIAKLHNFEWQGVIFSKTGKFPHPHHHPTNTTITNTTHTHNDNECLLGGVMHPIIVWHF